MLVVGAVALALGVLGLVGVGVYIVIGSAPDRRTRRIIKWTEDSLVGHAKPLVLPARPIDAKETDLDAMATLTTGTDAMGMLKVTHEENKPKWGVVGLVVVTTSLFILLIIAMLDSTTNSGSSTSGRYLSDQTRQKLYYDMIAVQEQYPGFSNEWNQGVKESAAKSYGVSMNQINDIIEEGASKHWLQPSP